MPWSARLAAAPLDAEKLEKAVKVVLRCDCDGCRDESGFSWFFRFKEVGYHETYVEEVRLEYARLVAGGA